MGDLNNGVEGDWNVRGTLRAFQGAELPAGSLDGAVISPSANIGAEKLEHQHVATKDQESTAVTRSGLLHIVKGITGLVLHVTAYNQTACAGASTVTVDIKKNNTTILSSVITLNSATGDRGKATGVVSVTEAAVDDVFTYHITTNASGTDALATGVGVQMILTEKYAA